MEKARIVVVGLPEIVKTLQADLSFRKSILPVSSAKFSDETLNLLKPHLIVVGEEEIVAGNFERWIAYREQLSFRKIAMIVVLNSVRTALLEKLIRLNADDYLLESNCGQEIAAKGYFHLMKRFMPTAGFDELIRVGNCEVDWEKRSVRIFERDFVHEIEVTESQFRLLYCLIAHKDKVVTREVLANFMSSTAFVGVRVVDVHLCALRKRLEAFNIRIVSIRKRGYIFEASLPTPSDAAIGA